MRSLLSRIGAEDLPRDSAMCGEGNVATFSNVSYLNETYCELEKETMEAAPIKTIGWPSRPVLRRSRCQTQNWKFLSPMRREYRISLRSNPKGRKVHLPNQGCPQPCVIRLPDRTVLAYPSRYPVF